MNIEVSGVFDRPPRYGGILILDFLGELPRQFADLDDAHAAGILQQRIAFKGFVTVLIPSEVLRYAITVHDDLAKQDRITLLDKAAPPPLKCFPGTPCRWTRW